VRSSDRFRDEALARALDDAIAGGTAAARAPLFDRLRRASALPGPRANLPLVRAFAGEAAHRGAAIDPLLAAMRQFHEDVAPFGHVDEYLAICAVAGIGARAAADPKARGRLLQSLEDAACDDRSRIRDEVAVALVSCGNGEGPAFADVLARWIEDDEPYLARAVLAALRDDTLLLALGAENVARLVDAAFARIAREHRGGRRHEAFRRLVRTVEEVVPAIVGRHPSIIAVLERHAANDDEDVRAAIEAIVPALDKGRTQEQARALSSAIAAAKKPSRDPRWDRLPGKRGRGKR
jgi:hypothetical protein